MPGSHANACPLKLPAAPRQIQQTLYNSAPDVSFFWPSLAVPRAVCAKVCMLDPRA
ncbi:MAG: hypothetical protein QOC89_4129 [Paraburkholderia sp.]|jgi:hypothetical protein|nr:hypothetical protein [Paraburkholderia sp.]